MRRRLVAVAAAALAISPAGAVVTASHAVAANPAPQVAGEQASVMSVETQPDGTIVQTTYSPAPGVSADELAASLTAQGVRGVSVEGPYSAAVAACAYGTARTWPTPTTCFARWTYNGYGRPQMYFRDRSNDTWPVGRAVTKWNETSGIDSWYRDFSQGCPNSQVHCVIVYNAHYGQTGWLAETRRTLSSDGRYYTGAYIALNESYGGTEVERWSTACHEIGHVLGLDHNTSTTSCLYTPRVPGRSRYPHSNDFTLLERYY